MCECSQGSLATCRSQKRLGPSAFTKEPSCAQECTQEYKLSSISQRGQDKQSCRYHVLIGCVSKQHNMQGRAHVGAYPKDSRIAAVIIIVVMQEMDRHCLIPRSHDRDVQFRDHPVCDLIPPASLQHDLHVDRGFNQPMKY